MHLLVSCFFLLSWGVLFASAQGNDGFSSVTASFDTELVIVSFVWVGEAGHQLHNISMELMSGKNTVNDIMIVN
ncbi:hypothetical protein B0H19DRAFT_1103995 [Mycena capillaripes]|nr:hypothetical protein B0H19DRAFT_1103995 [Mycena capillaripes]